MATPAARTLLAARYPELLVDLNALYRPPGQLVLPAPDYAQRLIGWGRELRPIVLALGLVLIVRTVVAEPYHVPSPSMVPTLLVGDLILGTQIRMYAVKIGYMVINRSTEFKGQPEAEAFGSIGFDLGF